MQAFRVPRQTPRSEMELLVVAASTLRVWFRKDTGLRGGLESVGRDQNVHHLV